MFFKGISGMERTRDLFVFNLFYQHSLFCSATAAHRR
jgi:hypothetical protein